MNQLNKIWKDPVWSQVIAGLIIAWLTALTSNYTKVVFPLLGTLSILAIAGTVSYKWYQGQNSGFKVETKENYIGMGGNQKEIQVYAFQTKVISKFPHPIKRFNLYIQSNVTNEVFSCYINLGGKLVKPDQTHGIPPKATFDVLAPFTGNGPELGTPLTPGEFYEKLGDFTFYLLADGKEYSFRFSEKENRKFIDNFIRNAQKPVKPKITLKQS